MFLLLILRERKDILEYISLLQDELLASCCHWRNKFIPTTFTPDAVRGVPNGTITHHVEEFNLEEMGGVSPPPPGRSHMTMLPHVIEEEEMEEEEEFGPEQVSEEVGRPDGTPPPEVMHTEEEEIDVANQVVVSNKVII